MSGIIRSGISSADTVEMKINEININSVIINKDVKIAGLIRHSFFLSSTPSGIFIILSIKNKK
jgi:hypothetical protein